MTKAIISLEELLAEDLDYITTNLREELSRMAGKNLLITGGAGFLGYYLIQAALHFNETAEPGQKIAITVWDNFSRGTPAWLSALQRNTDLRLERRDLIDPFAGSDGRLSVHHPCRRDRISDLLP